MGKNNKTQEKKGKVTKKKKSHKVLKSILLIILLTILICAGVFTYKVYKNGGGLAGFVTTLVGTDPEKTKSLPDFYCLLMGKSQNMTDTIIVAKYSPSTGESALLSIPRDSFVGTNKNAATASDKINSKYPLTRGIFCLIINNVINDRNEENKWKLHIKELLLILKNIMVN